MSERAVDWLDLPRELLVIISKSLDPHIDVPRFRSVCSSWRSSIPPTHARLPLKFPHPETVFGSTIALQIPGRLHERTIYLLKPSDLFPVSDSSSNKGWLIKVEDLSSGGLHLIDPLVGMLFRSQLKPRTLNLLNFRIVELGKEYYLRYPPCPDGVHRLRDISIPHGYTSDFFSAKVVMSCGSTSTNAYESAAFLMLRWGRLAFARYGDEKLTSIDDRDFEHIDIIVYKDQFYAVDKYGKLSWMESSSLKLVQVSPPFSNELSSRKHLVESCGSLYVVDRLRMKDTRKFPYKTVDVKVYKLDEECGQWILMKSLGDRAFFLCCHTSFSVSASELVECKENCIYFRDGREYGAFDMENHSVQDFGKSVAGQPVSAAVGGAGCYGFQMIPWKSCSSGMYFIKFRPRRKLSWF